MYSKYDDYMTGDDLYEEVEYALNRLTTKTFSEQQIQQVSNIIEAIIAKQAKNLIKLHYESIPNNNSAFNHSHFQPTINIFLQNNQQPFQTFFPIQNFSNQVQYNQPFMNSNQPPINSMQPPVNSMQPFMNSNQPPMNSMRPFMNSNQPPMNSMQPFMNSMQFQSQPSQMATIKNRSKTKSSKKDKKSHEKSKKKDKKDKKRKDSSDVTKCPDGVFRYLFTKYGSNPAKNGTVTITGNSLGSGYDRSLPYIIDDNWSGNFWCSSGSGDRYVQITFRDLLVKIKKYRLRVGFPNGSDYFDNWTLTATDENGHEIELDKVVNSDEIKRKEATFTISNEKFVKSVRLTMNGRGELDNAMRLRNIEFYGSIKTV